MTDPKNVAPWQTLEVDVRAALPARSPQAARGDYRHEGD
jgi:hypothetical protein